MLEKNILNWVKENIQYFNSRTEIAKKCSEKFDISKSYAYKVIRRNPEIRLICNFWDILNDLNGDLVEEGTLLNNLEINANKWRKLRGKYNLDNNRVVVPKGKTRGVYIGNERTVEEIESFIKDSVL